MSKKFTLQELYNMLEIYQGFVYNGVKITSPIHTNGPNMCRQLISMLEEKENMLKRIKHLEDNQISYSSPFGRRGIR